METKKVERLIIKYLNNSISKKEWEDLNLWYEKSKDDKLFHEYLKINYAIEDLMNEFNTERTKDSVLSKIKTDKRLTYASMVMKYAAILVVVVASSYFFIDKSDNNSVVNTPVIVDIYIEPGINKAILTLEDGSVVELEKGSLLKTQNANSNGTQIIYKPKKAKTQELAYNYLTIPRGGQYFIKLSDGTKIWLNSESQLKYPVKFIEGKTREVELVYGEAYFDVSPSTKHRGAEFKVYNNKQEIGVLGTEFNIKAYKDESNIYTTLVEGKIVVNYENIKQNLKPNQQSNIDTNNGFLLVETVDVYNEISWKDGVFSFEEKSLKEMMVVLSRWYDVEIIIKNKLIENEYFVGILRKNQNLEEILTSIKNFGIIRNFEIKDEKIVLE